MEKTLNPYQLIFQHTGYGILLTDAQQIIQEVNPAFLKLTGYSEEEVIGKTPNFLKSFIHNEFFYRSMWEKINQSGQWQGTLWNRKKNGELYPEWVAINAIKEGSQVIHYVAVFSDISSLKNREKELQTLAYRDALTHLPNRLLFNDRLTQSLWTADRTRWQGVAVFFIDLDGFKRVNDDYGHLVGDALLQSVAQRLETTFRKTDTVARLGGDEFATISLIDGVQQPLIEVQKMAQKTLDILTKNYTLNGHTFQVNASIGAALYPEQATDAKTLIGYADLAMYEVKRRGGAGFQIYQPQKKD